MRVLLITSTLPIPSGGGAMLLYRHFCERDDFTISVITDNPQIYQHDVPYPFLVIETPGLWNRLVRTRLHKPLHSLAHLFFGNRISQSVLQQAQVFDPDAIVTVAGNWSWTARLAKQVARRLDVPLVGSFMDWWSYNQIYSQWAAPMIDAEFRSFYRECDLALCISEGMETALGQHPNSAVIYPIGSKISKSAQAQSARTQPVTDSKEFTVAFAGNLGGWYGQMLEPLILLAKESDDIKFQLFGFDASWSEDFNNQVQKTGIYRGCLPLNELRLAFEHVDALFLVMGFDSSYAQVERTNFKSKFLEYLSFQKPIFMWGPDYCSAIQYAKRFDSAEVCTSPNPKDFLRVIHQTKNDKNRQIQLIENADKMYEEKFHPDKIHRHLVSNMKALKS